MGRPARSAGSPEGAAACAVPVGLLSGPQAGVRPRGHSPGPPFAGAQAKWLQRGPEPAGYRPGPSLQRGRIRPPTPTPGPWRVRLNSREAQRLATTTVFLEEEEEDAQEAGRRRTAQPPKEVFVCWGEPSGRAGLPVAQGRARAKQCSAHSTQFSCASVDSVEPTDGSLQASAECPKPDQSDLWEGRDL